MEEPEGTFPDCLGLPGGLPEGCDPFAAGFPQEACGLPAPSLDALCEVVEEPDGTFPDCLGTPGPDALCALGDPEGTFPDCISAPDLDALCALGDPEGTFPDCISAPDLDALCALGDPEGTFPECLDAGGAPCDPMVEGSCDGLVLDALCGLPGADTSPLCGGEAPTVPTDELEDAACAINSEDPTGAFATILEILEMGCQPAVSVSAAANPLEGNAAVFTFTRTLAPGDQTVTCAIDAASTASAADYTAPASCQAKFVGSATTTTLSIPLRPDPEADDGETLIINVAAGSGYEVGSPASATATIKDVQLQQVTIASDVASVAEGAPVKFTLTRSGSTSQISGGSLRVFLESAGASSPDDFQPSVPTEVVIAKGASAATFSTENVQESSSEGPKVLVLSVLGNEWYTIAAGSAAVELLDDDLPAVDVRAADAVASETSGSAAADAGLLQVRRNGPTGSALTVDIEVSSTGTCGTDFTFGGAISACNANSVTIPAGATAADITVNAINDELREGAETVSILAKAKDGVYAVAGLGARGTVTLQDNDIPVVTVGAVDKVATENGGDAASFKVERTAVDQSSALTVPLAYTGTAARSDFTAPDSVTIAAGQLSATVSIAPVQDNVQESAESVIVTITAPSGSSPAYQVGSAALTVATITDDDIDSDADGLVDSIDNCALLANADQTDTDGDKSGDACDADDDNDGLVDSQETGRGTKPLVADSDGDGIKDGAEVDAGTNPLDANSPPVLASDVTATPTGDGMSIAWTANPASAVARYLVFRASTPTLVGSVDAVAGRTAYEFVDKSTFEDGNHTYYVQSVLPGQTGSEFNATRASASPEQALTLCKAFTADSDKDGLCDAKEAELGTDVFSDDSDSDGVTDQAEFEAGSDPLEPNSIAGGEVAISGETPFWVGLGLALATLVALLVGFGLAGRRTAGRAIVPEAAPAPDQDAWMP